VVPPCAAILRAVTRVASEGAAIPIGVAVGDGTGEEQALAGQDLDTIVVPGTHRELLHGPGVAQVARRLDLWLEAAEASGEGG
jgi:hypothetical protein